MFFGIFIEICADPLESAREVVRYLEKDLNRKEDEIALLKRQLGLTERHATLGDAEIKKASEINSKLQELIRSFELSNVRQVDVNSSLDLATLLKLDGENSSSHLNRYYKQSNFQIKESDYIFPKTGVLSRLSKNSLDPKKLYDKFVLIKILINVGIIVDANASNKAEVLDNYIRAHHTDLVQFLDLEKDGSPFKRRPVVEAEQ